jgi:hypothetical protein
MGPPYANASAAAVLLRAAAMHALSAPSRFGLAAAMPWLHLGETRYCCPSPLRGMARASASLLEATRAAAELEATARRSAGAFYRSRLVATPVVFPVLQVPRARAGDLRFPVRVAGGMDGFAQPARARALGIAPAYPAPLTELPVVRQRLAPSAAMRRMPGAEALARQLITLPTQ